MTIDLFHLYRVLLEEMGPQGWWPAQSKPEIILGAILVQNTNWRNVEKSLHNIKESTNFDPNRICSLSTQTLQTLIQPSGFYTNKSKAIQSTFAFFESYDWDYTAIAKRYNLKLRDRLLKLHGIGQETADVLLVYIFDQSLFIADKYARTLYHYLTHIPYRRYEDLAKVVTLTDSFDASSAKEFHGLIDEFGKQYLKNPQQFQQSFLYQRRHEIL